MKEVVMALCGSSGACTIANDIYLFPRYQEKNFLSNSKCCSMRIVPMNHRRICTYSPSTRKRHLPFLQMDPPSLIISRRVRWPIGSNTDKGADPSGSDTGTRLIRVLLSFWFRLKARIKEFRKGLPTKLLFFLSGFYCATAFATVIGQTGDWDILSAGLAVVVVEVVGALMYRASLSVFVDRIRGVIIMFNYWKAGISLGLFLDAFKYEDDTVVGSCDHHLFDIDIDLLPFLW